MLNPYLVLGVPPSASFEELKRAYRRAVLRYHPDTAKETGNAEKFNAVIQAYNHLKLKHEKKPGMSRTMHFYQPPPYAGPAQSSRYTSQTGNNARESHVDNQTYQMSLEELISCLEFSDNLYVRRVAIEAIALKKTSESLDYLISLLNKSDAKTQQMIIESLGQKELHQAKAALFPLIFNSNVDIAIGAIKSLEKIQPINRRKIIQALKRETLSPWKKVLLPARHYLHKKKHVPSLDTLGEIVMREYHVSEEQLELSLLLQKRFHLLLGQILRELDYLSVPQIQKAIARQKMMRSY
ncbi:MAG: HEAT repeat domain-containing protein [SAR324 cluster bacterium]|nr:HEAT repeat domain-containing protein [SAR324 cluster bacterium]